MIMRGGPRRPQRGMTHVRTTRSTPQSNEKLERSARDSKPDAIRSKALGAADEAVG